jgi:hypothetical protein
MATAASPGALGVSAAISPPRRNGGEYRRWPIRFDATNLWPEAPGLRFNPSIMADGDGYLFAARDKWWGSGILVGRMDAAFRPIGPPSRLELGHPLADTSREDPRLFRYRGQPHVSFTGLARGLRSPTQNQLYASLSADGSQVEEIFAPHYPARQRWEKNWGFFEYDSGLFAVYSLNPCRILKIDGNSAELVHETTASFTWDGGEIRGGAAPVRVRDEFWCFTHDRIMGNAGLIYRTGLVVLDGQPPFPVRRMIPRPILVVDPTTRPANWRSSVVFACGAVPVDDHWVVSHGVHDHWSELHRFSHVEL